MIETEVAITPELLERVLREVTSDAVLVGGQALAIWVEYYDIEVTAPVLVGAISDDADFIGSRADLAAIAKAVSGIPEYVSPRVISALVGQVKIRVAPSEFVNIDVLHKLVGLDAADVRRRASEATLGTTDFFVMHPLDVLCSRVENLANLVEKQGPQGIEQTRLAVLVARAAIEEMAAESKEGQRTALNAVEYVVRIGKSGAGRKVTKEFGIDFRGGVPSYAIKSEAFHKNRWPQILLELDPLRD